MKYAKHFLFLATMASSFAASASQVSVSGSAYSSTQCAYYAGSVANLNFQFSDQLAYGSSIRVRFGFHNGGNPSSGTDWVSTQEVAMTATAPYVWSADATNISVDSRGGPFFDKVEFVFEITRPDGSTYFDNGGSTTGYYTGQVPERVCNSGSPSTLVMETVKK